MSEDLRVIAARLRVNKEGDFSAYAKLIEAVANVFPADAPKTVQLFLDNEGTIAEINKPEIVIVQPIKTGDRITHARIGIRYKTPDFLFSLSEIFGRTGSPQLPRMLYLEDESGEVLRISPSRHGVRMNACREQHRLVETLAPLEGFGETIFKIGEAFKWEGEIYGNLIQAVVVYTEPIPIDRALDTSRGRRLDILERFNAVVQPFSRR